MKISEEVREYAKGMSSEEIQKGMDEMSEKFKEKGSEVYLEELA